MVISNEMSCLGAGWRFHGWCSNQPSEGVIIWISCKNPYLLFWAHLFFYIVKFYDCLLFLTHLLFILWNLLCDIHFLSRNWFGLCLTMLRINQQSHSLRWGFFLHIKWLRFSELTDLSISPISYGFVIWTTSCQYWIATLQGLLEARVELRPLLTESSERLKDLIFLDIALDSTFRTAVERSYEELNDAAPEVGYTNIALVPSLHVLVLSHSNMFALSRKLCTSSVLFLKILPCQLMTTKTSYIA